MCDIRDLQERYYRYTIACILYNRKRKSVSKWKKEQEGYVKNK